MQIVEHCSISACPPIEEAWREFLSQRSEPLRARLIGHYLESAERTASIVSCRLPRIILDADDNASIARETLIKSVDRFSPDRQQGRGLDEGFQIYLRKIVRYRIIAEFRNATFGSRGHKVVRKNISSFIDGHYKENGEAPPWSEIEKRLPTRAKKDPGIVFAGLVKLTDCVEDRSPSLADFATAAELANRVFWMNEFNLTAKEMAALKAFFVCNMSNEAIGKELGLDASTVGFHRFNALKKVRKSLLGKRYND